MEQKPAIKSNHTLRAENSKVRVKATEEFSATIRRGEASWAYIYTLLGFALTIETGVMGLIKPLQWPWNLMTLVLLAGVTIWLFLDCGWFQNKLLGIKARYEGKFR